MAGAVMPLAARLRSAGAVDFNWLKTYYFPVMSATLPESVDAWRMVSARRSFQGSLPIAAMRRLCEVLADDAGVAQYELDFGRDEYGTAYVDVRVQAPLWLVCQRTLEPFIMPVTVDSRLGMIRSEREESALPPGCEPLLVAEDDKLSPIDVIEDELLLALPLVPVNPDGELPEEVTRPPEEETPTERRPDNPFAVLRELKKN
jgi:uncharacterized protein